MDWSAQAAGAAASYAEFMVPGMFAPFAERLVHRAAVEPGSIVLDVACGTGAVSRAAARRAGAKGSVTGVDLGEAMLAIARARAAEDGAAGIEYLQSDAATLPLHDDVFDVALCQQGLQFFADRNAALGGMRRALKSTGRLAVATWKDIERSPFIAIADALARHVGREAAEMMRSPFGLADGEDLARVISAAGFRDVVVDDETIECTWASHAEFARRVIAAGPVAPAFAGASEGAQIAVVEEVAARLAPHAAPDGTLRMPMTSNVAVARP